MGNSLSQCFSSIPAAKQQLAFDDAKSMEIGIFWDYENVRVPRHLDVCDAWNCIRKAVDRAASDVAPAKHAIIAERRLYFDSRSPGELNTDRVKLDLSGFTLVDCPQRNKKETLDKKIIVDLMHFAWERYARRTSCCVVLISSDADYSYMLSRLRDLGTVVVVVHDTNTSDVLLHSAHCNLHWKGDVLVESSSPTLPLTDPPDGSSVVVAEPAAGRSPPRADSPTPSLDPFVTLLCAWIESKGVQRVTASQLGEFYQANPSADRSVLPAKQKLEFLCDHAGGRLRFVLDAKASGGGWVELGTIEHDDARGPVNLGDLRAPVARLGDLQEVADVSRAMMNSPLVLGTETGIGDGLTTNLSAGYLNAFLICLRKQQKRAGEGDETNYTKYWVLDAQVAAAYYQLKGFKDQNRYKSVKESARVGGFVEIGDAAPGAVKLRLTPMGAREIRQLTDADAEGAD
mmetsp:Transcript_24273/g.61621  ORF Transcript_24273/g.61621 Transcript_24273/m.61621 type:complete len:458 (+) Transcript_24273:34-1407(+)